MVAARNLEIVPQNQISIAAPVVPTVAEIDALNAMCKIAAYSGFLNSNSKDVTQRAADAFFVMMYGRELGIPAMTSLKTIFVIDGKPSCSGQALLSLMRRGGVEVDVPDPGEVTDKATVKVKRPGGEWKSYSYTLKMAEAAGLAGRKDNWKKHPAEMLIWRAVSTACRFEAPDIVGGLYTVEELDPNRAVNEAGDPLDTTIISPPVIVEPEPEPEPEPSFDEGTAGTVEPPEASEPKGEDGKPDQIPDDKFNLLMGDARIRKVTNTRPRIANAIHKLWAEGGLTSDMSHDVMADAVIARLEQQDKTRANLGRGTEERRIPPKAESEALS